MTRVVPSGAARYASAPVKPHTIPEGASTRRARRLPVNRLLLAALVALVGLSATACNEGQAWVARINGETIAPSKFVEGISLYGKLSGNPSTAPNVAAPEYVVSNSDAGKYALLLLEAKAIHLLNERHGIEVTDADRAQTRTALLAQDQQGTLKKMPGWFLDQLVAMQADYTALVTFYGKGVSQEALAKKYYEANKDQFNQVCLDVIATRTQAEAVAALQRLDKGEAFAAVAKDVAKTSGGSAAGQKQDGDVGCVPITNVAQAFPDKSQYDKLMGATDGSLVGPLSQTGGGFVVARKRSVKTQTFDEVKATILSSLGTPGSDEATKALNAFLGKADIEINPRFGTWTKGKGFSAPTGAERPKRAPVETTPSVIPAG